MRLSTRSRYGTRMMLDIAERYEKGPVQLGEIARRQHVSAKYLEQIIIPLKKANFVKSVRGAKGGHVLARPPREITVAEIVSLLEGGHEIAECAQNPDVCDRIESCPTRLVWEQAADAMYERLSSISLYDLLQMERARRDKEGLDGPCP